MAVRLISAYLAQKRLNPTSRHDVRLVHEKYSSRRFEQAHGVRLISAKCAQKCWNPTF